MSLICNFCLKEFSGSSVLKKHQLTAKFCLKIQGIDITKKETKDKDKKIYECNDCFTKITTKKSYTDHLNICKAKKIREIKDSEILLYKTQVEDLEKENEEFKRQIEILSSKVELYKSDHECVQEIAKQPKNNYTQNNNKYINLAPLCLTKTDIENTVNNNFLEENFLQGQEGVANFAYNNFLLDEHGNLKYLCNDPNRYTFTFKSKDGVIDKDYKATKLTSLICEDVINKSVIISNNGIEKTDENKMKYIRNLIEIKNLKENNTKFAKKLTTLTLQSINQILDEDVSESESEDQYVILSCSEEEKDSNELLPLYNKHMEEQSHKLDINYIKEGVNGYVNFALNNTFKNRIKCVEYSLDKQVLSYLDKNNKIITDITGYNICERFFKSLYNKTIIECEKYEEEIRSELYQNKDISENERIEYINFLNKMMNTKKEIIKIKKGEVMDSDFFNNFIDELCKRLLISDF